MIHKIIYKVGILRSKLSGSKDDQNIFRSFLHRLDCDFNTSVILLNYIDSLLSVWNEGQNEKNE